MDKIHVLHVNFDVEKRYPYFIGGVPSVIQNIMNYAAPDKISHFLLTADFREAEHREDGNNIFLPFQFIKRSKYYYDPLFFRRLFKKYAIDIVHFHHSAPVKLCAVSKLAKPGIKLVESIYTQPARKRSIIHGLINRTFAIDGYMKGYLLSRGIREGTLGVLPIVPDYKAYFGKPGGRRAPGDKYRFLFSPGPRKEMGLYYLLDQADLINGDDKIGNMFHFDLSVTDVPELKKKREDVAQIIKVKGLENVSLVGFFPDLPKYLESVDGLVYPILEHVKKMSTPLMMIESMMLGKLVISTRTAGSGCLLNDKNSIGIRPGAEDLYDACLKIFRGDYDAERMREEGRRAVLDAFSVEKISSLYYEAYRALLKGR